MRSTSGDLLHCFAFRHFPLFPQFQERNEEVQMLDNFDIFMCNFLLNKCLHLMKSSTVLGLISTQLTEEIES